jgi:hypothetical protein
MTIAHWIVQVTVVKGSFLKGRYVNGKYEPDDFLHLEQKM